MCFCMADRSGDILVAMLDRPAMPKEGRPLVVLVHGLTGCENSSHVLNAARHLLDRGYRVLRMNLRGCGASRPHCREHYHIGRTADFRRVLSQLPNELTDNGVVAVGYSLGGAMLLKYLGEEGSFSPLRAAATICAPLDLAADLRAHAAAAQLALPQLHSGRSQEGDAGRRAASCRMRSARSCGWRGPSANTTIASSRRATASAAPTTTMNCARRLPTCRRSACPRWCWRRATIRGSRPDYYRDFKWSDNPSLLSVMAEGGGHLGFHSAGSDRPWCDTVLEKFLERV